MNLKQAFTLIELLVVIAIIGILAGIIVVSMGGATGSANDARRKADINQLSKVVMVYKTNNPDNALPIETCAIGDSCSAGVLTVLGSSSSLKDPDGTYYTYSSSDGNNYTITANLSNGLDNYSFDSSTGKYSQGLVATAVNGVCGTAVRTFAHNEDSYASYTQCSVGTPSNTNFPAQGSSETWTCSGQNGGNVSSNCTASRDSAPWVCGNTLIDSRNSKTYNTVQIGTQCWMKENMDYNNGCQSVTWVNDTDKGWCGYYTGGPYANEGLLYQWSAAMNGSTTAGAQGICPAGWHVPTHDEWTTMERSINGSTAFPYDTTTTGWLGTNEGSKLSLLTLNGTNLTGFTALMSGTRHTTGAFGHRSLRTLIWSSSPSDTSAWARYLNTANATVYRLTYSKVNGFSVRCIKN